MNLAHSARTERGFSLPELMIAMLLGLMIMAAAASLLSSVGAAAKEQRVQTSLAQDASSALAVIAMHLRMAGYKRIPGAIDTNLFGCDSGFDDPRATSIDDLRCGLKKGASSSIAIRYEVDEFNSEADASGVPVDCTGKAILAGSAVSGAVSSESRFFVRESATTKNPALYCGGNGGSGNSGAAASKFIAQSMVDNVEFMQIGYGVDGIALSSAAGIDAESGLRSDKWNKVREVRVCLQMRSDIGVSASRNAYLDCNGKLIVPAIGDTRMHRSFAQVVQLRNVQR